MTTDKQRHSRQIRHSIYRPRLTADEWAGDVQCARQDEEFDCPAEAIANLIEVLSDVCEVEGVTLTPERVHQECCLYAYIDGLGTCALDVSLDFVREILAQMEAER